GGYATLTRGQTLGLPLGLLAWGLIMRRPRGVMSAALYSLGFVVVLVPWAARNARVGDRSVLPSSNVGWDAAVGQTDSADGGFWSPLFGHAFDPYLFLPPKEREVAMHRAGVRMAREWAVRHPADEARLALAKARRLWATDDDAVAW